MQKMIVNHEKGDNHNKRSHMDPYPISSIISIYEYHSNTVYEWGYLSQRPKLYMFQ